ncbi:MAG: response regulator transcription factor [Elusimicrobia bacterium]|nr:response regulator transcription factor [Elusimicrobiota bacterium]
MANRKRILIVDDDSDLVELLNIFLTGKGYELLTASDGKQALQLLGDHPVDLVLLDVMMPYMDGYHVAFEISNKMGTEAPKIVLMTSRDTVREKGVILLSGAHSVMQKPFDLEELDQKIREMLV